MKNIKIGPWLWKVLPVGDPSKPWHGSTYADEQAIYIRSTDTPQVQACTLLHELLHAIFATFPCLPEGVDEEALITALEMPLAAVIRDNPDLMAHLGAAMNWGAPIV